MARAIVRLVMNTDYVQIEPSDRVAQLSNFSFDAAIFEVVRNHRGSISAEHGVGLLKRQWLGHSRSPAEIAMQRAVKRALDPNNTLNPGKVLEG